MREHKKVLDISLWCDCGHLVELEPTETDWHGENTTYKCPKCNRTVHMECGWTTKIKQKISNTKRK